MKGRRIENIEWNDHSHSRKRKKHAHLVLIKDFCWNQLDNRFPVYNITISVYTSFRFVYLHSLLSGFSLKKKVKIEMTPPRIVDEKKN